MPFAMTRIKVPSPTSGGLLLTYKCSARCRHCMYACSPEWRADWMSTQDLELCLSRLVGRIEPSPWGAETISLNHGLHFTGGEPFMNFGLLLEAARMADELGIPSTFVETNCSWCTGEQATEEKLRLLRDAGLRGILISVNPYYAEYVPFERTERCIEISSRVFGSNVAVYQIEYYRRFRDLGIQKRISVEDYLELAPGESLAHGVELFLMGRATRALRRHYLTHPAAAFFDVPCQPPFLREWHNHFDNYGNLVPGFCGGISLGSWHELDRLTDDGIDLDERVVLRYLIRDDVRGLLRFAEDLGYRELPDGYVSKCDLCVDIRGFLVTQGDFEELAPREFYEHLD
jgi:hypothetical protein